MHTLPILFVHVYIVALWHSENHQYPNISTHPLRLNTPQKRMKKKQRNDRKEKMITPWNWTYQSVTNHKNPKTKRENEPVFTRTADGGMYNGDPEIKTCSEVLAL